ADIRADIYSLGCTLYCLLSGAPPFPGKSVFEILQAHLSKEATPLDQVRADVPAGLAAVVAKMMAKDPARRFQKPAEVVPALAPGGGAGFLLNRAPKAEPAGDSGQGPRAEIAAPRQGARAEKAAPRQGPRAEKAATRRGPRAEKAAPPQEGGLPPNVAGAAGE